MGQFVLDALANLFDSSPSIIHILLYNIPFSLHHAMNCLTSGYGVVCHNNVLYYLINPDSSSLGYGQH